MTDLTHSCQRCQSPLEPEDLRCPICALAVEELAARKVEKALAEVLRCNSCGASVTYQAEVQAPQCAFCSSVMHLERPEDPLEEPDWFLPFIVEPAQAHAALHAWLKKQRRFFTPSDVATRASLHALRPLWWVSWVCDAEAEVTWTADSNARTGRAAWAPQSGHTFMRFDGTLVPATRGLFPHECSQLSPGYNPRTGQREPRGPQGAWIERFDMQRSLARQYVMSGIHAAAADRLRHGAIPGSSYRNVRVSALLSKLHTQRFALPAYVLAYRYRGTLYRALIHGQNPHYVVGKLPFSWFKLLWIIGIILAILILPVILIIAMMIVRVILGV